MNRRITEVFVPWNRYPNLLRSFFHVEKRADKVAKRRGVDLSMWTLAICVHESAVNSSILLTGAPLSPTMVWVNRSNSAVKKKIVWPFISAMSPERSAQSCLSIDCFQSVQLTVSVVVYFRPFLNKVSLFENQSRWILPWSTVSLPRTILSLPRLIACCLCSH